MGNVCVKRNKKVTLVMVGLDNAGKTTAAKGLIGECPEDVAPTFGFSSFELRRDNFDVTLYDLGGSRSIRSIWRNYLAESFGFVFVVDASDQNRAVESREVLHDLLKNPTVSGKPLLILANKQDLEGALDDVELVGLLEVESLANETKSRTRVEICSALYGANGKKPDRHIQSGFKWLLTTIGLDYEGLRKRVEEDVVVQRQIEAVELRERTERVTRLRQERATVEDTAVVTSQEELETTTEMSDFLNGGDPFKPISAIAKELEERIDSGSQTSARKSPVAKVIRVASADVEDAVAQETTDEAARTNEISSRDEDDVSVVAAAVDDGIDSRSPISRQRTLDNDDDLCLAFSPSKIPSSIMGTEVIELDKSTKSRKRKIFSRNNKTSPVTTKGPAVPPLPPLIMKTGQQRMNAEPLESRHTTPNGFIKLSWGLAEELDILESSRLPEVS